MKENSKPVVPDGVQNSAHDVLPPAVSLEIKVDVGAQVFLYAGLVHCPARFRHKRTRRLMTQCV